MATSHDFNKHESGRMRRVIEKCSSYYWWHHVNALYRAETIQEHLPPENISFIRIVRMAHQRIYTSPPLQFIRSLHPDDHQVAVLEDESGQEFKVDFFDKKWSLSNGWKELCAVHKLVKGDYLVFHLVQTFKFEVYVVKQTYEAVVDKTPTISNLGSCLKENVLDKNTSCGNVEKHPRCVVNVEKHPRKENSLGPESQKQATTNFGVPYEDLVNTQSTDYLARTINSTTIGKSPLEKQQSLEKTNTQLVGLPLCIPQYSVEVNNFGDSKRRTNLENQQTVEKPNAKYARNPLGFPLENIELNNSLLVAHSHPPSDLILPDKDVKASQVIPISDRFKFIIDGIDISSQIPERTLISYSNLCHIRKSLLHSGLTIGNNLKHAIFIICETVHISNAIKNCNISPSLKEITYWRKSLESFSMMGMDVEFMRERVYKLLDLAMREGVHKEKVENAKAEGEVLEEKIQALELEIDKTRKRKREIDDERESNWKKTEELETLIKLEACAPW